MGTRSVTRWPRFSGTTHFLNQSVTFASLVWIQTRKTFKRNIIYYGKTQPANVWGNSPLSGYLLSTAGQENNLVQPRKDKWISFLSHFSWCFFSLFNCGLGVVL